MILDSIKNAELYYPLNPRFKAAFDFLAQCNPKTIAVGRHDIIEGEVFVNMLVYRNKIIAADISSGDPKGFVLPITKAKIQ